MGGFQLLPFYEGVRELGLVHHLIEDERSGAFAADAYARMTGRPGTCDATLGPGATNLVTGLVESLNGGIPLVAVVGDAHRSYATRNMTQETQQIDILRPAVKEIVRVEDGTRIPELVRRAFAVATAGRPGPVVIVLPEDVSHGEFEFDEDDFRADETSCAIPARRTRPDADAVMRAADLLAAAERPLILAGGGVHLSRAYDPLLRLCERHGIPVAHTLSGKGAVPCVHPLSVGVFGRYSRIANDLILESDCLLVVGCKLGEIATKRYTLPLPSTPIIHLDVSAEEIGRWTRVDAGLWGDAGCGLADLEAALGAHPATSRDAYGVEVGARKALWASETRELSASDERPIVMPRLIAELRAAIPDDGVLVADGGFASHWAGLLYDATRSGRTFVADRGFASIGYGLPGSIGAQLAHPGGPVVGLTGDGGLTMTAGGLEVARRIDAPITLVVVNNAASGYVKALQHAVYGAGAYQSSDLVELDFGAVARAFGCHGARVDDPADLSAALAEAIAHPGPSVVDVAVTRDPAEMLPGLDSRAAQPIKAGDRPA
ncbi:Acetolactate synthase large subunit [Capillimicrobium parvum]|uniref:Acetolactate synthase large subunit n=2 Tax=Capillimicrobium parvum TaxID=2884022 RepID=A0A9E7BW10_9ACTN|nr:Acetolactate synthase large subunit [Capillimicrobium parvum]